MKPGQAELERFGASAVTHMPGVMVTRAIALPRVIDQDFQHRDFTASIAALVGERYCLGPVGFYPFELDPPWFQENGLIRHADSSLEFISPGIARTAASPAWLASAIQQGSLAISVMACPHHTVQTGPARIVTISKEPWLRNVTIAQDGHDLVVRLRRLGSDPSGIPPYVVPGTFEDLSCRSIDLQIEPLRVTIYVNGVEMVVARLRPQSLDTWTET